MSCHDISFCNRWCFSKKICQRGVVRVGKGVTLIISNEDLNQIIRIIKPLQNVVVLIDKVSETMLIIILII